MTMKPHLDYTTNYDVGTDSATAIQPVVHGEAASQGVFRRPSENLRQRSEKIRDAVDELIYFRDHGRYVMQCASSGVLSWDGTIAGGGSGVLDNTTELTVSPFGGSTVNVKGVIGIGTAGTNRIDYEVQSVAYATHGVNRWRVEHRSNVGQVSIQVFVGDAPNRLILVTFDGTNNSHDAFAVATAVNAALNTAGIDTLLVAVPDAVAFNACSSSSGAVSFFDGVVSATISGTPTIDAESHTIPANALGTLTGATPLAEGSTILIAYRDLIEPAGGDPLDPKGGDAGGRAESNAARGNTDVTANLVVLEGDVTDGLHLSGAIPLVRIVNGLARFVDGTSVRAGYSVTPGSATAGYEFDPAGFTGPTTLESGGGLLTTDETLSQALTTADRRLRQRRTATWTVTDSGGASTGGDFDDVTGISDAAAACTGAGGVLVVRRGTYVSPAAGTHDFTDLVLEGEGPGLVTWEFDTAGVTLNGPLTIRNMRLTRALGVTVAVVGGLRLHNCVFDSGLFSVSGNSSTFVELDGCTMAQTSQAATPIYGLRALTGALHVKGGSMQGPDTLCAAMSSTPDTRLGVFDVLTTTRVVVDRAHVTNDVRFGWRLITCESDNTDVCTSARVELLNGGDVRTVDGTALPGSPVDLSSSKSMVRYGGTRGDSLAEPSRTVVHPALTLDLSAAPSTRTAPAWQTPELEMVEIVDPRTVPAAGYVALPAQVTLTSAVGPTWQIDFGTSAVGTLSAVTQGDVFEIVNYGFYRVKTVNLAANGTVRLVHLDGRPLSGSPPAGTQTVRYYRVVRGHNGGLTQVNVGSATYAPTEPDLDYLPVSLDVKEGHRIVGGLTVDGDDGGGFAVGRRRTGDTTPTGENSNFTPDFIVGSNGITAARLLHAKDAEVSGNMVLGAHADLEQDVDDIEARLANDRFVYATPKTRTVFIPLSAFQPYNAEWQYAGTYWHSTAHQATIAVDLTPFIPSGATVTEVRSIYRSGSAQAAPDSVVHRLTKYSFTIVGNLGTDVSPWTQVTTTGWVGGLGDDGFTQNLQVFAPGGCNPLNAVDTNSAMLLYEMRASTVSTGLDSDRLLGLQMTITDDTYVTNY